MTDSKFPVGCCPQCGLPYGSHHPMCGYGRVSVCAACGGSGRMGPYWPGGLSTTCGNCALAAGSRRAKTPKASKDKRDD